MKELEDALGYWRRTEAGVRSWEETYAKCGAGEAVDIYKRLLDARSVAVDAFRKAVLAAQRPLE